MPRTAPVHHPPVYAVMATEPIFHFKWGAFLKRKNVSVQSMSEILRMYTFGPTISQLLFESSASEFQPASIAVGAEFFGVRHPNHYRGRIGHFAKAPLAFPQRYVRLAEQSIALLPLVAENRHQERG